MSLTWVSIVTGFIAQASEKLGYPITVEALGTTLNTLVTFGALTTALYGRVRVGDVSWLGFRK